MIYFPTSREETDALIIGKEIYEKRKDSMSVRTEAILDYAYRSSSCRVERMLAYFGEDDSGTCGKCDVCRKNKSKNKKEKSDSQKLMKDIVRCLEENRNGATLGMIEKACGRDFREISSIVSFLCNEGFVECNDQIYRLL